VARRLALAVQLFLERRELTALVVGGASFAITSSRTFASRKRERGRAASRSRRLAR
jgi:hypothetical protein